MAAKHFNPSYAIEAIYTPQRIPQYRGNPFIEALPAIVDEDELLKSLFSVPEFDESQRDWNKAERLQMIAQLSSFMVPAHRHLLLAQHIDTLMRQGYVGRAPRTAESQRIYTRPFMSNKRPARRSTLRRSKSPLSCLAP